MKNAVYANALAKALENNLIGKERLLRMADAESAEAALKVLAEVNFGNGISVSSPAEFEKLFFAETKKLNGFIKENCPIECFKDYFLAPFDFHNAEAFIRAKHLKIAPEKLLCAEGLYAADVMKDKIFSDSYGGFYEELSFALKDAEYEFVSGSATGAKINLIFKKALYKKLEKESKKDKTLKQIYRAKADYTNLSVAFRTKNYSLAKSGFVSGGTFSEETLKSFCENGYEELKQNCVFLNRKNEVLLLIQEAEKGKPFFEFERMAYGIALSVLGEHGYSVDGNFPFMRYCFFKQAEIANVRIVLSGLLNGNLSEDIKRRLRSTYEG